MPILSILRRLRRKSYVPAERGWQALGPAGAREPFPEELVAAYRDTAYFCANMNARAVGRATLRLYVRTAPGELPPRCPTAPVGRRRAIALKAAAGAARGPLAGDEAIDEVRSHPLLELLRSPCRDGGVPLLTGGELLELTQLALELVGRAYWQVVRDGLGVPIALWPLPAHRVRPIPGNVPGRVLDGYALDTPQGPVTLAPAEVLAFRMADLDNPFAGGVSPTRAAFSRLALIESQLSHQRAVFGNRARPDVLIAPAAPETVLGEAEARRLETAFAERFQGRGAGGVFVARDPLRVETLSYQPKDLGELSEGDAHLAQVARAFDIPLALLHRDANRASAEQARHQHEAEAVRPRLLRIEERLNRQLAPLCDPTGRLFFRFDDPRRENAALALKIRATHLELGFTTINEERAEEGWAPVPWGDAPWRGAKTPTAADPDAAERTGPSPPPDDGIAA